MILSSENLHNIQKVIIFAALKVIGMNLSEKEEELVQALRNYRRAYPNGERNLEVYIMDLVYELMEHD